MVEYVWSILNLERELIDGYVFKVYYSISLYKDNEQSLVEDFFIDLERPENELIPYESLTEDQVILWVKNKLGDKSISTIETYMLEKINGLENKQVSNGLPW